MTRTIIGAVSAIFLTAGVGGVTVYHARSSKLEVSAPAASATQAPSEATAEAPSPARSVQVEVSGNKKRVSVGGIVAEKDGERRSVKIGSGIEAERDGQKKSVRVGDGISVQKNGDDSSVQVGGTRVERNGKHVSIGGISVDQP